MAEYKLVDIEQLEADLTTIANDIRAKIGSESKLNFPIDFSNTIRNISNIRAVTGSFTTTTDWSEGATAYGTYTIDCPSGAKAFTFSADDATVQSVKSRTITATTYFTLGCNCLFTDDFIAVNSWPCLLSAWTAAKTTAKAACAGVAGSNENGISFQSFTVVAGTYNWVAYYWDDESLEQLQSN